MKPPARATPRPARAGVRARPAGTRESRSRRTLTLILVAGAVFLLVNAIVGENGYLATLRLQRDADALTGSLARVRVENQQLRDDRTRLETDPDAIEHAIREQLGFVRPGEITVVVRDVPAIEPAPSR